MSQARLQPPPSAGTASELLNVVNSMAAKIEAERLAVDPDQALVSAQLLQKLEAMQAEQARMQACHEQLQQQLQRSRTPGGRRGQQDAGPKLQESWAKMPASGVKMPDVGARLQESWAQMQASGAKMQDPGLQMPDEGSKVPGVGTKQHGSQAQPRAQSVPQGSGTGQRGAQQLAQLKAQLAQHGHALAGLPALQAQQAPQQAQQAVPQQGKQQGPKGGAQGRQSGQSTDMSLHKAAQSNNVTEVSRLVARGLPLHARESNRGQTPLHFAAKGGADATAQLLLQLGADKDARDKHFLAPLHWASTPEVVQVLVSAGADPNLPDKLGSTPLHYSSVDPKRCLVMKKLLQMGADANSRNAYGRTPLHKAAEKGSLEAVQELLVCGADVNCRDQDGDTALHCAAVQGHCRVVQALVGAGAVLNYKNKEGLTAVSMAAAGGRHPEVAKFLMKASLQEEPPRSQALDPAMRTELVQHVKAMLRDLHLPHQIANQIAEYTVESLKHSQDGKGAAGRSSSAMGHSRPMRSPSASPRAHAEGGRAGSSRRSPRSCPSPSESHRSDRSEGRPSRGDNGPRDKHRSDSAHRGRGNHEYLDRDRGESGHRDRGHGEHRDRRECARRDSDRADARAEKDNRYRERDRGDGHRREKDRGERRPTSAKRHDRPGGGDADDVVRRLGRLVDGWEEGVRGDGKDSRKGKDQDPERQSVTSFRSHASSGSRPPSVPREGRDGRRDKSAAPGERRASMSRDRARSTSREKEYRSSDHHHRDGGEYRGEKMSEGRRVDERERAGSASRRPTSLDGDPRWRLEGDRDHQRSGHDDTSRRDIERQRSSEHDSGSRPRDASGVLDRSRSSDPNSRRSYRDGESLQSNRDAGHQPNNRQPAAKLRVIPEPRAARDAATSSRAQHDAASTPQEQPREVSSGLHKVSRNSRVISGSSSEPSGSHAPQNPPHMHNQAGNEAAGVHESTAGITHSTHVITPATIQSTVWTHAANGDQASNGYALPGSVQSHPTLFPHPAALQPQVTAPAPPVIFGAMQNTSSSGPQLPAGTSTLHSALGATGGLFTPAPVFGGAAPSAPASIPRNVPSALFSTSGTPPPSAQLSNASGNSSAHQSTPGGASSALFATAGAQTTIHGAASSTAHSTPGAASAQHSAGSGDQPHGYTSDEDGATSRYTTNGLVLPTHDLKRSQFTHTKKLARVQQGTGPLTSSWESQESLSAMSSSFQTGMSTGGSTDQAKPSPDMMPAKARQARKEGLAESRRVRRTSARHPATPPQQNIILALDQAAASSTPALSLFTSPLPGPSGGERERGNRDRERAPVPPGGDPILAMTQPGLSKDTIAVGGPRALTVSGQTAADPSATADPDKASTRPAASVPAAPLSAFQPASYLGSAGPSAGGTLSLASSLQALQAANARVEAGTASGAGASSMAGLGSGEVFTPGQAEKLRAWMRADAAGGAAPRTELTRSASAPPAMPPGRLPSDSTLNYHPQLPALNASDHRPWGVIRSVDSNLPTVVEESGDSSVKWPNHLRVRTRPLSPEEEEERALRASQAQVNATPPSQGKEAKSRGLGLFRALGFKSPAFKGQAGEKAEKLKTGEKAEKLQTGEKVEKLRTGEKAEKLKTGEKAEKLKTREKAEKLKTAEILEAPAGGEGGGAIASTPPRGKQVKEESETWSWWRGRGKKAGSLEVPAKPQPRVPAPVEPIPVPAFVSPPTDAVMAMHQQQQQTLQTTSQQTRSVSAPRAASAGSAADSWETWSNAEVVAAGTTPPPIRYVWRSKSEERRRPVCCAAPLAT